MLWSRLVGLSSVETLMILSPPLEGGGNEKPLVRATGTDGRNVAKTFNDPANSLP